MAVLSVVVFHAFPSLIPGGFVGVDIFFVISGFLISTIIIDNLDSGAFSFSWFYSRRIKRIFPALILVLLACFAFGWRVLFDEEYAQLSKHIAAGAGFISNLILWKESGYFDGSAETKPLLHLWSLGVEEQFYIVWPLLLWFVKKRGWSLPMAMAILTLLSFVWNIREVRVSPIADFYSPQARFWELGSGGLLGWLGTFTRPCDTRIECLAALFSQRLQSIKAAIGPNAIASIGLCLIAFGMFRINQALKFPGFWAVVPVLGAVLVIGAGPGAWINRIVLANKVSVWVGLISYPLYLWHWPILSFSRILEGGTPSPPFRFGAIVLSVLLAWLVNIFVEKPLRQSRATRSTVCVLTATMSLAGLVGYATFQAQGLPGRNSIAKMANAKTLYQSYPHEPFHNEGCRSQFPQLMFDDFCLVSNSRPPEVLLFGDSHSNQFYKSFAKALSGRSVMNLGMSLCFPFSNNELSSLDECAESRRYVLEFIAKEPSIKTVYVMGYWALLESGGFSTNNENYRQARRPTQDATRAFIESGQSVLESILKTGKRVILVRDIPDLTFNIRSCFGSRTIIMPGAKTRTNCSTSRIAYEKRNEGTAATLNRIVGPFTSIKSYNPLDALCDKSTCLAKADEQPLYYNSDHLTLFGADLVVKDLLSKAPPD